MELNICQKHEEVSSRSNWEAKRQVITSYHSFGDYSDDF